MKSVSPDQKRFIAKGKLEGAIETLHENILEILELRFQLVPADIVEAI